MPSPRDSHNIEPGSAKGQTFSDAQRALFAEPTRPLAPFAPLRQTSMFQQPGVAQPQGQLPPTKPPRRRRPNERLIWYAVICGIVLIGVALGVMITAPLRAGQQKSTTQNAATSAPSP